MIIEGEEGTFKGLRVDGLGTEFFGYAGGDFFMDWG